MTTFRCDTSWSSLYAILEDVFMKIADDKDSSRTEGIYKMKRKEKELLDTFMYAVNTGLLVNKGSIDVNGKSTIQDPDTGRPIYIGEGLIPQIEAFASKFVYNDKPTLLIFNHIMNTMSEKALKDTGNHFCIVCNSKLWQDINLILGEYLANFRTDGTYMYSKAANKGTGGYVKVGATYNTYEYSGELIAA